MKIMKRTALVTGATGGLGQAIARELAARGASVVLTGRRVELLESLAADLGGRAIAGDLSDRTTAAKVMNEAGHVDILIANAGLPGSGQLADFAVDEIDRALDVNLRTPVVMARLAIDDMVPRRSGHLVFVSSVAGKMATTGGSVYNATKFGLRGFSLALREDMRSYGVGVSAIYPGFIRDAGMFADAGVTLPRGVGTNTPGDVARAVARAIECDLAEVDVAPLPVRILSTIAAVAPGVAAGVQRKIGSERIVRAIAEGHRDKR